MDKLAYIGAGAAWTLKKITSPIHGTQRGSRIVVNDKKKGGEKPGKGH